MDNDRVGHKKSTYAAICRALHPARYFTVIVSSSDGAANVNFACLYLGGPILAGASFDAQITSVGGQFTDVYDEDPHFRCG